jgi:hypothetical protein
MAAAAGVKSKALAARATRRFLGRICGAWRRVALPGDVIQEMASGEGLEKGEGLDTEIEMTGRTDLVSAGAGNGTPRRRIAEPNGWSGVSH